MNFDGATIAYWELIVNHKLNKMIDFLFTLWFTVATRKGGDIMNFDRDRFREAMGEMYAIDLADKLGCPKSSISMYLSGQREPSKMAMQLIALNLGVNPGWLAGLDVPKYSNAKIISVNEKPAANRGNRLDEKHVKLLELFDLLSEDQKEMIIAQLRGLMLRQTTRGDQ